MVIRCDSRELIVVGVMCSKYIYTNTRGLHLNTRDDLSMFPMWFLCTIEPFRPIPFPLIRPKALLDASNRLWYHFGHRGARYNQSSLSEIGWRGKNS